MDSEMTSSPIANTPPLPRHAPSARRVRSIAVTSGKGGVGKTNFVVNIALELAALGRSVALMDGDMALANANVLLGVTPAHHIGHVLSGQCALEDVMIEVGHGLRLIPGSNGVEELAGLSTRQHQQFIAELEAMENESDFLFIDTPSGLGHNVMGVLSAASEVIVVTTPDPTAIIDAYALIKTLDKHTPDKPIWIVVNSVTGINDGEAVFAQLSAVSIRFLKHTINYLGAIPQDSSLAEAVREQQPVVDYAPDGPASRSFRLVAKFLDQLRLATDNHNGAFWRSLGEVEV